MPSQCRLNYRKANYDEINRFLFNIDWIGSFAFYSDTDSLYNAFCEILMDVRFVPKSDVRSINLALPKQIQKIMVYKNQLWNQLDDSNSKSKYIYVTKRLNKKLKKYYQYLERKALLRYPTSIFSYVKRFVNSRSARLPVLNSGDSLHYTDDSKVIVFASYFHSVYQLKDLALPDAVVPCDRLRHVYTSEAEVYDLLLNLRNTAKHC